MVKIWNFLLPATGKHQLRVEDIGTAGQRIFIDGVPAPQSESCLFSGPEDSLLELRNKGRNEWVLLVNGLIVEDYHANRRAHGDESLRETRSKPDGSYLISTEFVTDGLDLNVVRKFRFIAVGHEHEVQIAHSDCVWQVVVDREFVERVAHSMRESSGEARFTIKAADGRAMPTIVRMLWHSRSMVWRYSLSVNGMDIEACWTKAHGPVKPPVASPVVFDGEELSSSVPESAEADPLDHEQRAQDEQDASADSTPLTSLPQGVSYDSSACCYQANVRLPNGRFAFLGEFLTAEEAHQSYLEALPKLCPEKKMAPEIPTSG